MDSEEEFAYYMKHLDNRINDPKHSKPKYRVKRKQYEMLREQILETKAGLTHKQWILKFDLKQLYKVFDWLDSFN